MKTAVVLVAVFSMPVLAFSATIYVPDDYPTIQQAIDAAVDGDTIIVRSGTYVENIDFKGKAITVQSEKGPESTILDGGLKDEVVTFNSGEGYHSILDGFTVTNGNGGIKCGTATGPLIIHNIIKENHASFSGGGIYCYTALPTIAYNTISWNDSDRYGGGIYCLSCTPIIVGNILYRNRSNDGLFSYGGGICGSHSTGIITNNIFYGNKALAGGAIQWSGDGSATITNNTIFENTGIQMGGGLLCITSPATVVTNTIFWNNHAPVGHEICVGLGSGKGELSINYSDVQGGKAGIHINSGSILDLGEWNIDLNPIFSAPVNRDFHLTCPSPCKDTGDNFAPGLLVDDFEGDPRIAYGAVDMGADEFYTHLYCTGEFTPDGLIEGKLVGLPGTSPVGLFLGSGVLDPPVTTAWGNFYLQSPWLMIPLVPIPANGALVLPATIPGTPPAPYDLPMQALFGIAPDSLSDLFVMEVR
ncbi:MAG: right-handed parallel beta-helix repeat-containing protein [Planctomycetota bacterium]|jgi:hypothetical protein